MSDQFKNFAKSRVATAPSPATTGTSLVVTTGHGTRFPTVPFNVVIYPVGQEPTPENAEIATATVKSTDTLTIVRAQEGTTARSIIVGDQIAQVSSKAFFELFEKGILNVKMLGAKGDGTTDDAAAITAAYAALPSNGGILYFPPGQYRIDSALTFATVGKRVLLQGQPGSVSRITYTPTTGVALTFNYGNDLDMGHGMRDLGLIGAANNNASKGVVVGGANGAQGFLMDNCKIRTFGTGVEIGSHVWITTFRHSMIRDCTTLMVLPTGLTETGEQIDFDHVTFADSPSPHTNSVWIKDHANMVTFRACSFDQAQLSIGDGVSTGARVAAIGCHFENPNLGTNYDFIVQSNHNNNFLRLTDCNMEQAKTSAGPTQLMTLSGGKVHIAGLSFQSLTTLTNLAVLANGVGVEIFGGNNPTGNVSGAWFGGTTTGFVLNLSGADVANPTPRNLVAKAGDPTGGAFFDIGGILRSQSRIEAKSKLYPGTPADALQTAAGIYAGSGAPVDAQGSNGDIYIRSDPAGAAVFQRIAAVWVAISQTPLTHKTSHENGGSDEINVAGLSGLLGDAQIPVAHATSHNNNGSDEISVSGLSGLLGDAQTPLAHASSHNNAGSDEISVAGLSGLLADGQTPLAHKASHQSGGSDAIKLDDLAAPDDNTDLNASTSAHGLLLKLAGGSAAYLRADGTWVNPETGYGGTYQPALTNVTNLDGSTTEDAFWVRRLNTVFVEGRLLVNPTATGATQVDIALPVASDLGVAGDLTGSGFSTDSNIVEMGFIAAETTNNRAKFQFTAVNTGLHELAYRFAYTVI